MNTDSNTFSGNHGENARAFSALFNQYRDKLYAFVLSICHSPQQAEDIVQDVFLKIWQQNSDFKEVINFEAYMFRMAHNHCINILKRVAREATIVSGLHNTSDGFSVEEELSFKEAQAIVSNAIDHLPAQQKRVFMMSRELGYKQEEISRELHISVPTVKSHMTQAMKFLKSRCKSLIPVMRGSVK